MNLLMSWSKPLQATRREDALDIENVTNFFDFCNPLVLSDLWNEHFPEFGDNGLLSCMKVVGADSRKWGHFEGICARLSVPLVIAGWWDWSKNFGKFP